MPFRRRRRRPPDRTRLKSVWRRALRSPSAQSHHPGVSGDPAIAAPDGSLLASQSVACVAIPGPVVAAVLRIGKKQCVGPLRVENTWIFERRLWVFDRAISGLCGVQGHPDPVRTLHPAEQPRSGAWRTRSSSRRLTVLSLKHPSSSHSSYPPPSPPPHSVHSSLAESRL
eukprot:scaffold351_cov117-Isochrysis_galbana.AAC.10